MKKVALDFDNVLADTMTAWIKVYNNQYNQNLEKAQIKIWKFWDPLKMSRSEAYNIFHKIWYKWQDLQPLESNIGQTVDKLREYSQLDIVTSSEGEIEDWLKYHVVNYDQLIYVEPSEKSMLDYDIFIDDSPDDAMILGRLKKACLLYDQPWNQQDSKKYAFNKYDTIFRINRLGDALPYIKNRL